MYRPLWDATINLHYVNIYMYLCFFYSLVYIYNNNNIEEVHPFITLQPRACLCYSFDLLSQWQKRYDWHYSDIERSYNQNLFYYNMDDYFRSSKQWSLTEKKK